MYGYAVHVKRFMVVTKVSALATVGFSFDDEPTVNSQNALTVAPANVPESDAELEWTTDAAARPNRGGTHLG